MCVCVFWELEDVCLCVCVCMCVRVLGAAATAAAAVAAGWLLRVRCGASLPQDA